MIHGILFLFFMKLEFSAASKHLICLEVGTQTISPLYWALESGSLNSAKAGRRLSGAHGEDAIHLGAIPCNRHASANATQLVVGFLVLFTISLFFHSSKTKSVLGC